MTPLQTLLAQAARPGGTPVVLITRKSKPLWLVMPYDPDNSEWLQGDHDRACYLVQALRAKEQCAPACWNAEGVECACSCMGQRHGEGHPSGRWYEISETCAISWGDRALHYKLLSAVRPAIRNASVQERAPASR